MSKIEWTDVSWNPVTGCTKISPGCEHCYAERMSKRLAGRFGYPAENPFTVTCHPDKLDQPLHWKKPRNIFVCSMGDLFHEDVPEQFIWRCFLTMSIATQHTYQVLTKRPKTMAKMMRIAFSSDLHVHSGPAPNVWLGTSCENQDTANERIPHLMKTPAAVRFLSLEPLLGPVDLDCINFGDNIAVSSGSVIVASAAGNQPFNPVIDWVIVGGETGPGARPMDPDWARDIRDQCKAAGVPFFFKAMGGGQPTPKDLMIREFPNT